MELDLTRPNPARMIDYWLGGTHNYEADRLLAEQVADRFPEIPWEVREGRAGLRRVLTHMVVERGIECILDFGAGLPTCQNTHEVMLDLNPEACVVYSDIDPVTVGHGRELTADLPKVIYLQCDAAYPEIVLEAPETQQLLGEKRAVGIVFMGLAHLMSDETLVRAGRTLYDWAAPGSCLYIASAGGADWDKHPRLLELRQAYGRFGHSAYYRTHEELIRLIAPWKVTERGVFQHPNWGMPAPDQSRDELSHGFCFLTYKPGE